MGGRCGSNDNRIPNIDIRDPMLMSNFVHKTLARSLRPHNERSRVRTGRTHERRSVSESCFLPRPSFPVKSDLLGWVVHSAAKQEGRFDRQQTQEGFL